MNRFYETFIKYPTDKPKYADFYNRYFGNLNPSTLLEIGVLKGGSHRSWMELFPNCRVVGIDIDQSCKDNNKDLEVYIGDQRDPLFLGQLISNISSPDIIIDDGSHFMSGQILSFIHLYPHLKTGGIYIIEDINTSYMDSYYDYEITLIEYMKTLIDPIGPVNRSIKPGEDSFKFTASSITFEPNICLLRK